MKKRIRYKSKKLLKVFYPDMSGNLTGPFQGCVYSMPSGHPDPFLAKSNAVGYLSTKVKGRLEVCENGFHAFDDAKLMQGIGASRFDIDHPFHTQVIYEVILYNCFTSVGKWVGDQFRIIRRISREELRDRRKALKKR